MHNPGNTPVDPRLNPGTSRAVPVISHQSSVIKISYSPEDIGQAKRYLAELLADCGRLELRRIAVDRRQNRFRWFDDIQALWSQARRWSGEGIALFTTINQPVDDAKRNRGLRDDAVSHYRRLLFDFDPERERGCNSTDEQLAAAVAMRDDFVQRMHAAGWPEPALAVSGNGAHAIYRVDVEVAPERVAEIRDFYRGLAARLRGAGVVFDTTTYNPARLCRLYGAVNRKCPGQEGMPQRVATVSMPPDYRVVPERALRLAMDMYKVAVPVKTLRQASPVRVIGKGDYRTLDAVEWFQSKGLYLGHVRDNMHAVTCPWEHAHSMSGGFGESVIFEGQGDDWPGFYCNHNHCQGRQIRQVIDHFGDADTFCREVFRAE
jgi:hypothetical protein